MNKSSRRRFSPLVAFLIVLATNVDAKISINLEPVQSSTPVFVDAKSKHYDTYCVEDSIFREECRHPMYLKTPLMRNIVCDSHKNSAKVSEEETIECAGTFDLDLSSDDVIEFSFQAPLGKALDINTSGDMLEFEFQGTMECPKETEGSNYQEIPGSKLNTTVFGSGTPDLILNTSASFLKLGKCEGCSECQVFTKLAFVGPIDGLLLSTVTWRAAYDTSNTISGIQSYKYSSQGYNWIRAETVSAVDALIDMTSPRKLQLLCNGPNYRHADCPGEHDVTISPTISSQPSMAPSVLLPPSVQPSSYPSTSFPSTIPSTSSSTSPSTSLSISPSLSTLPPTVLSASPSLSPQPSLSESSSPTTSAVPTITASPTVTAPPSITASPTITTQPSDSESPTFSSAPSLSASPSAGPSVTPAPSVSAAPSQSSLPSMVPSVSLEPSQSSPPTLVPSIAPKENCTSDSDGGFGLVNGSGTQVKFTFELETDLGSAFQTIRPPLETAFNNGLLPTLFDECTADNIFRISRRLDDVNETSIVGISSRPIDAILSDVPCAETPEGTKCDTIAAAITLYFADDDSSDIQVKVKRTLDALKDGMDNDIFVSVHPSIRDIRYVDLGTKSISEEEEEEEDEPPVGTLGGSGDDTKVGLIAGLVVGFVALCLVLLLLFLRRKRDDDEEDEEDVDFEALEDGNGIPNGIPTIIDNPFGDGESQTEAETEALTSIWETTTKELEVVNEEEGGMPDAISTSDSESDFEISSASSNENDSDDNDDSSSVEESLADAVSISSSDEISSDNDTSTGDDVFKDDSSDDSSEDSSMGNDDNSYAENELQMTLARSQGR